jgi:DNA-binding HxlR family transcriptional regulator
VRPQERYGQMCPLAAGLDVLGDAVTLLLIRELLVAGADFESLSESLADVEDGELSRRLDVLVDRGVVAEDSGRYHLTEFGEGLREPMRELSWWGFTLSLRS